MWIRKSEWDNLISKLEVMDARQDIIFNKYLSLKSKVEQSINRQWCGKALTNKTETKLYCELLEYFKEEGIFN